MDGRRDEAESNASLERLRKSPVSVSRGEQHSPCVFQEGKSGLSVCDRLGEGRLEAERPSRKLSLFSKRACPT